MTHKNSNADRSHGGPGSSHQDERGPAKSDSSASPRVSGGKTRSPFKSDISGGGGELDRHHTHHPEDRS